MNIKKLLIAGLLVIPLMVSAQSTLKTGGTGWSTSTIGDLFVGTSSTLRYTRLPIGTIGKVLYSNGTTPSWIATSSLGISGSTNLLPLDNTWSGTNLFNATTTLANLFAATSTFTGTSTYPVGAVATFYNTADETTNYERMRMGWAGNIFNFDNRSGGAATGRSLLFRAGGSSSATFTMSADATLTQGYFEVSRSTSGTDDTYISTIGTNTSSSGVIQGLYLGNTLNQSGTAGYTALKINPTETSLGSGVKNLIQAGTSTNTSMFVVSNLGNVNIGTSTQTVPLFVNSTTALTNSIQAKFSNSGGGNLIAINGTTAGNGIELQESDSAKWQVKTQSGQFVIRASGIANPIILDAASSVENSIKVTAGRVGLSTSTPLSTLDVYGDAIVHGVYGSTKPIFTVATTTSSSFATSSLFKVFANGNIGISGITNSVLAVDSSGIIIATTSGGTTYTGTYPIIVTGSVISTGFSTSTVNNHTAVNSFSAQTNLANASSSNISTTNLYATGTVALATTTVTGNLTLTGAFIPRVVGYTSSSTITLNVNTTDEATTTVNQTTTFANPTGTPINGLMYMFTLTATTTQTISWGTLYASSTDLSAPTSIASGTTEVLWKYDLSKGKYLLLGLLKTFQ